MENPSRGKVTMTFDFSHLSNGDHIGAWLRDIATDGTLEVYVQALWECGNAVGYYEGKQKRATSAQTRAIHGKRLAVAKGIEAK